MEGMNLAWGMKSSTDLAGYAGKLDDIFQTVNRIRTEGASKWKGNDFDSLALWWDQQGKTALRLTIEIIQQASKDLNQNAIAQQQKSSRGVDIA